MILKIKGKVVDYWNDFKLSLKYDSVASAFTFNFYLDPQNKNLVELSHVGHYHHCTVEHNGELIVSGRLISHGFADNSNKQLISIGGYSMPGTLEDCQIPPSIYPLQSDGLTLRQIANKLVAPFGIKIVVDSSVAKAMDSVYEVSAAEPTETIKAYLATLASQRNIILSHDASGNLLFTKVKTNQKPVADFGKGLTGTNYTLTYNGQGMHTQITAMKQADENGGNAGEFTIKNPLLSESEIFRPKVIIQDSGNDISTEAVAKTALAEELKNIGLTITTDRWEGLDGKLLKPNSLISILNEDLYIFKKSNFFIESIDYEGDNKSMTSTIKAVLPSVYDGSTPVNIFEAWQ